MSEDSKYEKLSNDYKDLQLRFTRFSAVEQELINARDRLDQELELYKRLQKYSYQVLTIEDLNDLLQIITEALVDILEIECVIVYYRDLNNDSNSRLIGEGVDVEHNETQIKTELKSLKNKINKDESILLSKSELDLKTALNFFCSSLFKSFTDNNFGYEIYFFAGNSVKNEKLYSPIEYKHISIFSIFVHQMQSVIANKKKNQTIEDQIKQISKSQNELKKLSLIATKLKSGVIISNAHGKIEWVNEAFTKISGYELEEIIGKKPKDFLQGPETTQEQKDLLSNALWQKEDIEIVLINRNKAGQPYYNQIEIIPVFDDAGTHINFIALQKDITEEIKYNQEIIKINSRFEQIANFSHLGIWERDLISNKSNWNIELAKILGIENTADGKDLFEIWKSLIHPNNKTAVLNNVNKLFTGEQKYVKHEYKIIRQSDNAERNIQSLIIGEYDENGKIIRMIGSMQDITEIKTLQYNLERAIEDRDNSLEKINDIKIFYERILKNSPTQILVFDKNLRLSFSNTHENASSSIWDIPENTQLIEGEPNIDLNKIHGFINDAIIQKKLVQIEDTFESNNQEVHYLRTILPYFNNKREIENIFVIGIDITELKRVENDIIQKNDELQKINLELDHFVYSISHDLRSPLLSIKGIIGLVLKSNTISEENKKFLEMTMSSATRLDNTIQEILDYSRNSRLEVSNTSFDIKELIEIVFEDLRFSANTFTEIEFNVTCATTIFSDKPRLGVLLKNVIGNCIKYRKPDVASKITVGINEINNALQIEIKDNGEGIPPKHVEKVFDMFYRASTTSVGTGLGLYICKEIASKLGGQILLESELGVGTTVTIILQNYKS
jgi:PAS domain S-box-containing protein